MFLSKLVLNFRDRNARRDLASPYDMHRTILSTGFDGVPKEAVGRVLFRTDEDRTGRQPPLVLIQSDREPDWAALPDGYVVVRPECKQYDPQFRIGQRLRFRLRANPTKRVASKNVALGPTLAGKRIGLFTEPDQVCWFLKKSETGGFQIPGRWEEKDDKKIPNFRIDTIPEVLVNGQPVAPASGEIPNFRIDTIPEGRTWNGKKGSDGWFLAVRFEGVLEVTDPVAFRSLVESGVGSAKGYGFGLLSIAPA